jgi:hypothetical protein
MMRRPESWRWTKSCGKKESGGNVIVKTIQIKSHSELPPAR